MTISRRTFSGALLSLVTTPAIVVNAPAIVSARNLMPVRPVGRFLPFASGPRVVMPGDILSVEMRLGEGPLKMLFWPSRLVTYSGMQQDPRTGLWTPA